MHPTQLDFLIAHESEQYPRDMKPGDILYANSGRIRSVELALNSDSKVFQLLDQLGIKPEDAKTRLNELRQKTDMIIHFYEGGKANPYGMEVGGTKGDLRAAFANTRYAFPDANRSESIRNGNPRQANPSTVNLELEQGLQGRF